MIEQIAALSAAPVAPMPALTPPSALVVERFNAVMNAAPLPQVPTEPVQSTLSMAFTSPASGSPTLGNQILGTLQAFSTEYGQKWQSVANRLNTMSSHASVSEMLRLQGDLLHIGLHTELISKVVARGTQNIDTLVRMS
jgi:type III secretion protein I